MNEVKLEETRIYGLNEKWVDTSSKEDGLGLMSILYRNIFMDDPYWHFFWEGDYTVIRHCEGRHQRIKQLVKANDPGGTLTVIHKLGGYQENIKITERYLQAFIPIFHGFSVLAMEMYNEDFISVLERINHCFLNMVTRESIVDHFNPAYISKDLVKMNVHKGMGWEGLAISMVANLRMWTAGWYRGRYYKAVKDEER